MAGYYTAAEAAQKLGVSRATLYAYVSRGLIRSEKTGDAHARRYVAGDVTRLAQRQAARKDPGTVATEALKWGEPVLESAMTLIDSGRLYYRGVDAVQLSKTATLEDAAALLWGGQPESPDRLAPDALRLPKDLSTLARFQTMLPLAAQQDPAAFDLAPAGVRRTGLRILRLLTGLALDRAPEAAPIAEQLARGWRCSAAGRRLIEQSLVLCADHELNVSAFTVRCVASSGASLYAAVNAGLSALQGWRHGGLVERVDALLKACDEHGVGPTVRDLMSQGQRLPGFGHVLYPEGDPRATALMASLETALPRRPVVRLARSIVSHAETHLGERPTLDFALAVIARALQLPAGSGLTLFALGRPVGWVGHALEAYERGELIRPRARYIGPAVAEAA